MTACVKPGVLGVQEDGAGPAGDTPHGRGFGVTPTATIFIPTRNRGHVIGQALQTILNQDIGADAYDVIVVDDDSDDDTAEVLRGINHPRLTWWTRKRTGCTALVHARNEALEAARGRILLSTDDDCFLPPDYLAAHLRAHGESDARVVTGPILTIRCRPEANGPCARSGFGLHTNPFPGCNGSVPRALLDKTGLYDTDFTMYGWEDLELWERLQAAGAQRRFSFAARVFHYKPDRPLEHYPAALRQEIMRGTMGALFTKKHPCFRVALQTKQLGCYRMFDGLLDAMLGLDARLRRALDGGEIPKSRWIRNLVKSHAEIRGPDYADLLRA